MKRVNLSKIIFLILIAISFVSFGFSAQDLTKELTLRDIMGDPPIEGNRPSGAGFSPDSRYVTFFWNDVDGNKKTHLWLSPADAGSPEILVDDFRGTFFWTEDCRSVVYVKKNNLYSTDIRTKKTEQHTSDNFFAPNLMVSPDNKKILVSRKDGIWMFDIESKKEKHLSIHNGRRLFWSPDSQYLAYVFKDNLYYLNIRTRSVKLAAKIEARNRSETLFLRNGLRQIAWSPDSRFLAFSISIPDHEERRIIVPNYLGKQVTWALARNDFAADPAPATRMGITDIESGETTWINHGDGENKRTYNLIFNWSPDGKRIFIDKIHKDLRKRNILLVEPGESEVRILYEETDDRWIDNLNHISCWSRDGKRIFFTSKRDGFNHIYSLVPDSGRIHQKTNGNWEINTQLIPPGGPGFRLLSDNKYLVYSSTEIDPSERHLYLLNIKSGKSQKLQTQEGYNTNFIISPDEKKILYEHSDTDRPYDYFVIGTNPSDKPVQISNSLPKKFKSVNWIKPDFITVLNKEDNVSVHARITYPPDLDKSKKYPALIFLHGGIFLQNVTKNWIPYEREFKFHHKMVHKGYVVIEVDIRGTSGYGKKFKTDVHMEIGHGKDMSDLITCVDYLRDLGFVDPERIGVYGGSGGGFMTLMALCLKPEYFACGAALRSLTDWKNYLSIFSTRLLGKPQDNPDAYKMSSPITHAEKLTRPLLLIHGLLDANSFAQESILFAERLIQAGIDFEFMLYPSERHTFQDPDCWVDEYRRIERFLDKHLLKKNL